MEKHLDEIEFLVGNEINSADLITDQRALEIFSDSSVDFLSEISEVLLKTFKVKDYPDVATFGFFCRRANLNRLRKNNLDDYSIKIGKGVIFHISPGNVPVNFAYSLFAGLVTGNINIVKVPSKKFEQIDIIVEAIKTVMSIDRHKKIFSNRLFLVRYDRESIATTFFSKLCDVRIIWGGDDSIANIRKTPISPKSTEITFSNRYSVCIIDAKNYCNHLEKLKLARDFYNDTYLFDQNACTSPQTIFWCGSLSQVENAKMEFWRMIEIVLREKNFESQPINSIEKLTTFYSQAISLRDIFRIQSLNDIWRVENRKINRGIENFICNSGYFNEATISSLDDLTPIISRKYQTLGYFGFSKEELKAWITRCKPLGIDRIVPIGRTMNFSLTWDGYNLVSALSRSIDVQ